MGAPPPPHRRSQGHRLTAIDGALALIGVLLVVQMWLLTATLEADLAGHHEVALPGALVSLVLAAAGAALYAFVDRIDAEVRGR
jgi:hypothetical protein